MADEEGQREATRRSWNSDTLRKLLCAGWKPDRYVWNELRLPRDFDVFPEAKQILSEFGGLSFVEYHGSTTLDPSLCEEIADEIRVYESKTDRRLYPIGKIDGGDVLYLVVDEQGRIYTITDRLEPFASSFDQAIKYIVRVCAVNRSEFQRDLDSIGLSGKYWDLR